MCGLRRAQILTLPVLLVLIVLPGCGDGDDTSGGTATTPSPTPDTGTDAEDPAVTTDSEASPAGAATGILVGHVRFSGEVPDPRQIQVTKDIEHCADAEGEIQDVVVAEDGSLADAIIEILGVDADELELEYPDPEEGFVIRQKGCRFTPHVMVVPDETSLSIYNDDPVQHNINSGQWNFVQGPGTDPVEQEIKFGGQAFTRITCNIHNWMEMWVYIPRSPLYARTSADGTFRIEGIPPGDYRARAVHPTLGTQRLSLTIASGEETELEDVVFE